MPINERRRDDIAAVVAAYDSAHPKARLPRNAARLLAVMFPTAEGFSRDRLPATLRRLIEAGFLSRHQGSGAVPHTYQLHLPSVRP